VTSSRPDYGFDAPYVLIGFGVASLFAIAVAVFATTRGSTLWTISASAVDQEPFTLQPFDAGRALDDDAGNSRMGSLDGPATHETVERFQRRVGGHRQSSVKSILPNAPTAERRNVNGCSLHFPTDASS
jgi:hypothetical protein